MRKLVALAAVLVTLLGATSTAHAAQPPWSPNDPTPITEATQRAQKPGTMFIKLADGRGYKLVQGVTDWPDEERLLKDNPRGRRIITDAQWRNSVNEILEKDRAGALRQSKPSAWSKLSKGVAKVGGLGKVGLLTLAAPLIGGANHVACAVKDTTDFCMGVEPNNDPAPGPGSTVSPSLSPQVAYVALAGARVVEFRRTDAEATNWYPQPPTQVGGTALLCGTGNGNYDVGTQADIPLEDVRDAGLPATGGGTVTGCVVSRPDLAFEPGIYLGTRYGSAGYGGFPGGQAQLQQMVSPTRNGTPRCGGVPEAGADPTFGYRCIPTWNASNLIKSLTPEERGTPGATTREPVTGWEDRLGDLLGDKAPTQQDDDDDADAFHGVVGPDDREQPVVKVKIPTGLITKSYDEAAQALSDLGLEPIRVDLSETSMDPDVGPSVVARSSPRSGTDVDPGTSVKLYVNPETAPEPGTDPGTEPGGEPGGGGGDPPGPPVLDLGPLSVPAPCDKFPFGIPCWTYEWLQKWGAVGAAPVIDFPVYKEWGIHLDLGVLDPVMLVLRTIMLAGCTIGMGWMFMRLAGVGGSS